MTKSWVKAWLKIMVPLRNAALTGSRGLCYLYTVNLLVCPSISKKSNLTDRKNISGTRTPTGCSIFTPRGKLGLKPSIHPYTTYLLYGMAKCTATS